MVRFILATFAFLAFAFYQMSGGSDFEPARPQLADVRVDPLDPEAAPADGLDQTDVTRVSLNLTSVDDVLEGRAAVPVSLPQQPTPAVVTPAVQQGESVTLIPSLVTGADSAAEPASTTIEETPTPVVQTASVSFVETRFVSGDRVNVRGGPGTNYRVVGRLLRGDEIEILEDTGTGWVRFQSLDGQTRGWIADFLLTSG